MSTYPKFGELLNQQLSKADRSPAWLARRLNVKDSTVSRWLNDGARPGSPEVVARIADALGMSGERDKLLAASGYGFLEIQQQALEKVEQPSVSLLSVEGALESARRTRQRNSLPQPITHFLGREVEIERLKRQLLDPECRLLTLIGPGGIGKTRLAIEVARQIGVNSTIFSDGVYFISMAEHDSPELLVVAIAEILDLAIDGSVAKQNQLLSYLHNKQMLLVLDNFEHRLDAVDRVAQILNAAAEVKVLVTSRERLQLPGEHLLAVHGLDYDNSDIQNGEVHSSAFQLFIQCARHVELDLELTEEGIVQVNQICRQVEGMPLGIELAASWIELLSPSEISTEIERSLDILARGQPSIHDAHHSIRAVFESTWRRLGAAEQQVYARLSCFPASFTREAAEVVAGATLQQLSTLVSKSLVRYQREERRYSLHVLLRQFAEEKLLASDELVSESYQRHCAFYSNFLEYQTDRLKGREHPTATREIEAEIENVRRGWQWACAHRHYAYIDQCLEALNIFYVAKAWYQECLAAFETAATALYMDEPKGEEGIILAKILARQGEMRTILEFHIEAESKQAIVIAFLQRSLDILNRLGRPTEGGIAYSTLAEIAYQAGDRDKAIELGQVALDIFTEVNDRWKQGEVLQKMSHIYYSTGNYPQAFECARQAIAISEEFGELSTLAKGLFHLGDALRAAGHYEEAKVVGERSLEASSAIGDTKTISCAAQLLGEVAWHMRDYVAAQEYADASLAADEELGLTRSVDAPLVLQGNIACSLGDNGRARSYFYRVLESHLKADTLNEYWGTADALFGMVNVLLNEGKNRQAIELLTHVLHHPLGWQETKVRAATKMAELGLDGAAQSALPQRAIRVVVEELMRESFAP